MSTDQSPGACGLEVFGTKGPPKHTHRLFLSVNLIPGPRSEPDVTSQEFLESFLDVGVWIRIINAAAFLTTLRTPTSSPLQRSAAVVGFYQQAGMQAEDALSNLIAWSVWAKDKSRTLPDLLSRTSLRFSAPARALPADYGRAIQAQFMETTKRVEVHPREYLTSISQVRDEELPAVFGIPWKRNPSVKDVPRSQWKQWHLLPHTLREMLRTTLGNNSDLLANSYNKIKHGPQLMCVSPALVAERRGLPTGDIEDPRPAVRILLKGARTQETREEIAASKRVAPFLYDDVGSTLR